MSVHEVRIVRRDNYLAVTLPAYRSVGESQSEFSAIYDAVDHNGFTKLLIDCRATRERIPILEIYELCLYVVAKFRSLYPRIAVIAAAEAVYADRFGESVARNRGLDLMRFVDNEQEALAWLHESRMELANI